MCSVNRKLKLAVFLQIAREHGIRFMETSAKANINIERAFNELAEAILDRTPGRDTGEQVDRVMVERRQQPSTSKSCCNNQIARNSFILLQNQW